MGGGYEGGWAGELGSWRLRTVVLVGLEDVSGVRGDWGYGSGTGAYYGLFGG